MTVDSPKAPSWFWTLVEGRAIFEFNSFYALRPLLRCLPKGDGHPVLVLPGFMASDLSTRPLRNLLCDLHYKSYGWNLGRNVVFNSQREKEMTDLLHKVFLENDEQKVSLIGWSLGGVFARELARNNPDKVRSIISLGSPISGNKHHSNAHHLFEVLNGKPDAKLRKRQARLAELPPVPCTSIYSKTDGIVAWQGSLQQESELSENICVPASHLGLGVNPIVMYAIADRLAQAEGNWKAFDLKGARKLFFRKS